MGDIQESLQLFQAAMYLNPKNPSNGKQVARSLFLLGRHKAALAMFEEVSQLSSEDWVAMHCFY